MACGDVSGQDFDAGCGRQHGRMLAPVSLSCGDANVTREAVDKASAECWPTGSGSRRWMRRPAGPTGWTYRVAVNQVRRSTRCRRRERLLAQDRFARPPGRRGYGYRCRVLGCRPTIGWFRASGAPRPVRDQPGRVRLRRAPHSPRSRSYQVTTASSAPITPPRRRLRGYAGHLHDPLVVRERQPVVEVAANGAPDFGRVNLQGRPSVQRPVADNQYRAVASSRPLRREPQLPRCGGTTETSWRVGMPSDATTGVGTAPRVASVIVNLTATSPRS